jgi:hypothetical protein
MMRFLPSRAAIYAALAALLAFFVSWLRRDARQDALHQLEKKDQENATAIDTRVRDDRADPERLRPFDDAGWRD